MASGTEAVEIGPDYLVCTPASIQCECQTTYQFYDFEEKMLLGGASFFIISFGVLANLISVRIFTHKLMTSACINWYLIVLTLSDTVILFSAFFVLTLPRFSEFFSLWKATSFSYFTAPCFYGFMTMAQTVSVWMTVALSIHRFIGVYYPYQAIELLNERNVLRLIFCLLAFSVLFNTTKFFEVHVVNDCFRSNIRAMIPVLAPTDLRLNPAYRLIFFGWAYTLLMFVVPFSILIVVNTLVLVAIRRSNRLHTQSVVHQIAANSNEFTNATKESEVVVTAAKKASDSKERQTTAVLIALVVVFLCCNTLAFMSNIMENLGYDDNRFYGSMVTYNNFLVIINASGNFLIYTLFSDKYRTLLRSYISRIWSIGKHRGENEFLLIANNGPVPV